MHKVCFIARLVAFPMECGARYLSERQSRFEAAWKKRFRNRLIDAFANASIKAL